MMAMSRGRWTAVAVAWMFEPVKLKTSENANWLPTLAETVALTMLQLPRGAGKLALESLVGRARRCNGRSASATWLDCTAADNTVLAVAAAMALGEALL